MVEKKKLESIPSSIKLLTAVEKQILEKSINNLSATVISFRGSGVISDLKYLTVNYSILASYKKDHLFTLLDLSNAITEPDLAFFDAISYISTHFGKNLDMKIGEELENADITKGSFLELLRKITFSHEYSITFIIDSTRYLYNGNQHSTALVTLLSTIKKVNPMKISFIFVADSEFTPETIGKMGVLSDEFLQNVVYRKNLMFDKNSSLSLFKNQELWRGITYSKEFMDKTWELGAGDPSVIRIMALKALEDELFQQKLVEVLDVKKAYELIGKERLDVRFRSVVSELGPKSLECLRAEYKEPTDFLTHSGLVSSAGKPINPLFDYYVRTSLGSEPMTSTASVEDLYRALSGQELQLFEYLLAKEEKIVSKDEIAQLIWGDTYEEQYSDWAIDKLVSTTRKKLKESNYPKIMKTFKGKGIMLS